MAGSGGYGPGAKSSQVQAHVEPVEPVDSVSETVEEDPDPAPTPITEYERKKQVFFAEQRVKERVRNG